MGLPIRIVLNGAEATTRAASIAELLREQRAVAGRVAVVVNDSVLPAAAHESTALHDGDRIELLAFAGGG